ncbi:MAG: glycosyltransferase family protein [Candidatus Thorarchaeota archaeon]|jgi:spore maturation protein CgeB
MKILYVTKRKRNRWNGTLHIPLQKLLVKDKRVRLMYHMPPIKEIDENYDIFFADIEYHAKNWQTLRKAKKVIFMEDVWSPESIKSKGRMAARMRDYADASVMRYESQHTEKKKRLGYKWETPVFFLPHCIDPELFKDWQKPKNIDLLTIGTLGHKATMQLRKLWADEAHRSRWRHKIAKAGKSGRTYKANKFSQVINSAKITGTTNTKWQVLAKCFEIPASRSMMMCNKSRDMEKMGFVDGETFVQFPNDKMEIRRLIEHYMTSGKERKLITDNAYELVHERHTIQQRAKEWFEIMEKVMEL